MNFLFQFGKTNTGLANGDLSGQFFLYSGSSASAATTTGFHELGSGIYTYQAALHPPNHDFDGLLIVSDHPQVPILFPPCKIYSTGGISPGE